MASLRVKNNVAALALLVVLATSAVGKTSAATYTLNWSIPSGGAADYVTFASQNNFHVGDTIVFNFPTGAHSLAIVTKQSYDSCGSSNPISLVTVGPARVNLSSPGEAYFICTFAGHCAAGQKLAINVSSAAAATPTAPPAPSPKPVTPAPVATPPTPSSPAPTPKPAAPVPTMPAPVPAPAATAPTPSMSTPSPAPVASVPSPAPGPGGAAPSPSPTAPSPNAPGSAAAPGPGGPADTNPPPGSAAPATPTAMATTLFLVMLVSIAITVSF